MNLKTYRAYTMAEALSAVKSDLGADAVVLHTRSFKRGGFLWIGRKTVVEVTATTEDRNKNVRTQSKQTRSQRAAASAYKISNRATLTSSSPKTVSKIDIESRRLDLLAAIEEHNRSQVKSSTVIEPKPEPLPQKKQPTSRKSQVIPLNRDEARAARTQRAAAKVVKSQPEKKNTRQTEKQVSPIAERFIVQAPENIKKSPDKVKITNVRPPVPAISQDNALEMQEEMIAIKDMVGQILQQQTIGNTQSTKPMPSQLFEMYLKMISQELSDDIADDIIKQVQAELSEDELETEETVHAAIRRKLIDLIPITDESISIRPHGDRPLTIALIGPTGVGKTTTLAKLAATFKLRHGYRVGLVTSDTYRIAAVDQLRTYANIIGLSFKVVLTTEEMQQACRQLRDCDIILIDTAGRSQKDKEKLEELNHFIDAANPHEVHLVLSSTASEKVLMQEIDAFSKVRADKVILTKLDEAVSFGVLINVMKKVGKELSFVTTGQEVPDHIEPGRADRLAELVLGGELHS